MTKDIVVQRTCKTFNRLHCYVAVNKTLSHTLSVLYCTQSEICKAFHATYPVIPFISFTLFIAKKTTCHPAVTADTHLPSAPKYVWVEGFGDPNFASFQHCTLKAAQNQSLPERFLFSINIYGEWDKMSPCQYFREGWVNFLTCNRERKVLQPSTLKLNFLLASVKQVIGPCSWRKSISFGMQVSFRLKLWQRLWFWPLFLGSFWTW